MNTDFLRAIRVAQVTILLSASTLCYALPPSMIELNIGSPTWFASFDGGGFSDWIYWGNDDNYIHPFDYHEVLSGEWAAAIYYDGIPGAPNAMWLTDFFLYPYWYTQSGMDCVQWQPSWDTAANPVPPNNPALPYDIYNQLHNIANDTGRSIIEYGSVRIKIDYEVADLGESKWSPMACGDSPEGSAFAKSDRYVLLQTYTITNIDPNETPLHGLEFYQMLHSHGADDYGGTLTSIYDDTMYNDPLSNYTPYNPAHTLGNFCYDITQWNDPNHPDAQIPYGATPHRDWVGFSTAQQPDIIENGYYVGHGTPFNRHIKPDRPGTHWNIEDRNLNGQTFSQGEVAGAMGWRLGSLDPNESASITVAFMVGYGRGDQPDPLPWSPSFTFTKTADMSSCVQPDDYITYTLTCANPITDPNDPDYAGTLTNATITDHLPDETWFISAQPEAYYNLLEHTLTWDLGNIAPGQNASVQATVVVNDTAQPLGQFTNTAILESDNGWLRATHTTDVCCWGGDVIYVRANNPGLHGTSWQDAYPTLEQALARAANGCGNEIWVATGTYTPPGDESARFTIFDGLLLYGGFAGNETQRDQRDFVKHSTILDGVGEHRAVLEPNQAGYETTIIDGFIVTGATQAGISILNCSNNLHLTNCLSHYNTQGLYSHYSDPNITACVFANNAAEGVACYEGDRNPTLDRCKIHDNASHGLHAEGAAPKITNSFINRNAAEGISLDDPNSIPTIRNCTITANTGHAIHATGQNPPNVTNSILWYNNAAGNTEQKQGCSVTYSCLYDPNDVPGSSTPDPTTHNITANPNLAYGHPATSNDFHLAADSPCIDQGHNNAPNPDYDLDNDIRPHNSTTDIGADESACSYPLSHPCDLNYDGLVNLHEYATLATAWLAIPADLNWNASCDFDTDDEIALPDLAQLSADWPWKACWRDNAAPTWIALRATDHTTATPLAAESLNTTRQFRAQTYQPTLLQQIWQLEDLLTWAADLYVTDEQVRQTIPEPDYKTFLDQLYNSLKFLRLQHYLETTNTNPATLPEDFQP